MIRGLESGEPPCLPKGAVVSEEMDYHGLHDESEFHGLFATAVAPSGDDEPVVERWTKYRVADGVFPVRLDDGVQLVLVDLGPPAEVTVPWLDPATDPRLTEGVVKTLSTLAWRRPPSVKTGITRVTDPSGDQVCLVQGGAGWYALVYRAEDGSFTGRDGDEVPSYRFVLAAMPLSLEEAQGHLETIQDSIDQRVGRGLGVSRYAVVQRRLESVEEIRPGMSRRNYSIASITDFADQHSAQQAMQGAAEAYSLRLARDLDGFAPAPPESGDVEMGLGAFSPEPDETAELS